MAKIPSTVVNLSVGAVALEGYITGGSFNVTQQTPDVEALPDAGPRVVVGNYGWNFDFQGGWDGASGAVDATVFGDVGDTGEAVDFDPSGAAAGANNPHYTGTGVLTNYTITFGVGNPVTYSAGYTGNSALTRAVA